MADPSNPTATTSSSEQSDLGSSPYAIVNTTAATAPTTGAGATSGSSLSSDLSNLSSGVGSFLSSPLGSLTEFGTLAGIGLSQASSQKSENDALAGSLTAAGAPYTAAGAAELSQLEGGPAVGGPLGASITQQTTAAQELGQTAEQYGTGQLTSAQTTQVQQYVAQQKAAAAQELANAGITDPNSTQYQTAMQQIDNNAATMTQQLITSNTQLATGSLSAVQSTYSNLLNQALSSSEFGFTTEEAGVQLQIQSDTQLSQSLESLFAGIAQGVGSAFGGSAGKTGSNAGTGVAGVAAQAAGAAGSALSGNASTTSNIAGNGITNAESQENVDLQQEIQQSDQQLATDQQNQLDQQGIPQVNMPDQGSSPFDPSGTGPAFGESPSYDMFSSGDPFGGF